jgi:hypothetical protein
VQTQAGGVAECWRKAEEIFESILREVPDRPSAHAGLGSDTIALVNPAGRGDFWHLVLPGK